MQTGWQTANAGSRLSRRSPRKAPLGKPAFQPYWGKLDVRNDRGIEETAASFEARSAPRFYPTGSDKLGELLHSNRVIGASSHCPKGQWSRALCRDSLLRRVILTFRMTARRRPHVTYEVADIRAGWLGASTPSCHDRHRRGRLVGRRRVGVRPCGERHAPHDRHHHVSRRPRGPAHYRHA